jgi:iron complex transport system permease protein
LSLGPHPAAKRAARLRITRSGGLVLGVAGVLLITLLSLRIGSLPVSNKDAWDAIFRFNPGSYEQTVVRSLRVPRTAAGLAIGASLAGAGAVMQGVTRNPLADPFILGVSSGSSLALVTIIFSFGLTQASEYVWFAFAGALAASTLVFIIGSAGRDGPTPV